MMRDPGDSIKLLYMAAACIWLYGYVSLLRVSFVGRFCQVKGRCFSWSIWKRIWFSRRILWLYSTFTCILTYCEISAADNYFADFRISDKPKTGFLCFSDLIMVMFVLADLKKSICFFSLFWNRAWKITFSGPKVRHRFKAWMALRPHLRNESKPNTGKSLIKVGLAN